jgi:hypothetical protein
VVRVQAHLFPFLSPQPARPVPHAGRHRDPAQVVQQPGPADGRCVGGPGQLGRRARQLGDPSRVAGEPRALQVGGVPEPGQGLLKGRLVTERATGPGLGADHGCPQVIRAGDRRQLARPIREDRGDLRIQRAS